MKTRTRTGNTKMRMKHIHHVTWSIGDPTAFWVLKRIKICQVTMMMMKGKMKRMRGRWMSRPTRKLKLFPTLESHLYRPHQKMKHKIPKKNTHLSTQNETFQLTRINPRHLTQYRQRREHPKAVAYLDSEQFSQDKLITQAINESKSQRAPGAPRYHTWCTVVIDTA